MKSFISILKTLIIIFILNAFASCKQSNSNAKKTDYFTSYDEYLGFMPDDIRVVKTNFAHSGNYVSKMDTVFPYSLGLVGYWGKLTNKHIQEINVDCWVYPAKVNQSVFIVCSYESVGNPKPWYYEFYAAGKDLKEANTWQQVNSTFYLPDSIDANSLIKIYLWNQSTTTAFADDLGIQFIEKVK